jgi:hypothetical protein
MKNLSPKKKGCRLCLVVKSIIISELLHHFVGPFPPDYCIGSNFWKFYLIKIGLTSGELVSLAKEF